MDKAVKELDQLQHFFLKLRDQAYVKKEHFCGVDVKREAEMRGYALAYTYAAGQIFELIKKLEN